jgi:hypothetical protein
VRRFCYSWGAASRDGSGDNGGRQLIAKIDPGVASTATVCFETPYAECHSIASTVGATLRCRKSLSNFARYSGSLTRAAATALTSSSHDLDASWVGRDRSGMSVPFH